MSNTKFKYNVGDKLIYVGIRDENGYIPHVHGGRMKKDGSIGSIKEVWIGEGDKVSIKEIRPFSLILKNEEYWCSGDEYKNSYVEVSLDTRFINPFEYQTRYPDRYNVEHKTVELSYKQTLNVNDLFGDEPTDMELETFLYLFDEGKDKTKLDIGKLRNGWNRKTKDWYNLDKWISDQIKLQIKVNDNKTMSVHTRDLIDKLKGREVE
jgi:hypothetical protein